MQQRAVLINENGRHTYVSANHAHGLVSHGRARIVGSHPLTVEIVAVERVRSALIPRDCPEFRDEYLRNCDRALGRAPRWAVNPVYEDVRRLKALMDRAFVPQPAPTKHRVPVRSTGRA